jgi:tetratricopeptide (TPR) repeat protein
VRNLRIAAALLAVAAATPALHAQRVRVHDVPARPALWAGADTNSANVYYLWGLQHVEREPVQAAAAFYWAERLHPGWPDALYGRRMALLMTNAQRLVDYVEGKHYLDRDAEMLAIDSLALRASQRAPFLYTALERPYWELYFRTSYRDMIRRRTGVDNSADAEYLMRLTLANQGPGLRAWNDYASGRFPLAAQEYEQALRGDPRSFSLRVQMGHARYLAGDHKGAATAIAEAISQWRDNDRREVVRLYESKAVLEFSRAVALEDAGDTTAAREAFSRALEEDLAFWPVHRRLAEKALESGDTTTAHAEMALAVELAPAEADLRYDHGMMLIVGRKPLEGVAELAKAIELDPYFAEPHYVLALLNDQAEVTVDAVEHYRHFLDRAPRDDTRRAAAEQRLAALSAAAAAPAP